MLRNIPKLKPMVEFSVDQMLKFMLCLYLDGIRGKIMTDLPLLLSKTNETFKTMGERERESESIVQYIWIMTMKPKSPHKKVNIKNELL